MEMTENEEFSAQSKPAGRSILRRVLRTTSPNAALLASIRSVDMLACYNRAAARASSMTEMAAAVAVMMFLLLMAQFSCDA